jgi:hypothetical protein
VDAMTEEDVEANVVADQGNPLLTSAQLASKRRVSAFE